MKRRWFWRLSALTLLIAIVLAGGLVLMVQPTEFNTLQQKLEDYRFAMTGLRLSVIALIALAWPKLLRASVQRGHFSQARCVELKMLRWRIVTWLMLIELLVAQNLFNGIWRSTTGPGP